MKHHFRPSELKLTPILVGLAICLYGCSSSYTVSSVGKPNSEYSYQEMNQELNGRHVGIELEDGRWISAEEVMVSNDSLSWLDEGATEKSTIATRHVRKVAFKNRFLGALEGIGFCSVGGLLWGIVADIASKKKSEWERVPMKPSVCYSEGGWE